MGVPRRLWSAGFYAASAPTLQCAPSESTNCASTLPKSCFLGGLLNRTPLAPMSRQKASTSTTVNTNWTSPPGFLSEAGCSARVVSPVTNSLQPGDSNFSRSILPPTEPLSSNYPNRCWRQPNRLKVGDVSTASGLLKPCGVRPMCCDLVSSRINSVVNDEAERSHPWNSPRFRIDSSRSGTARLYASSGTSESFPQCRSGRRVVVSSFRGRAVQR